MPLSLPPFLRRHWFLLLFAALLGLSFAFHATYRQRYIGAVDWYGYYQEALLFKAGRTTLPMELSAATYPSAVPLGFWSIDGGKVVPQYPPGFPLLLALGSVVGLEFYIPPLIGLASCLVLFVLIKDLTGDRLTAALYAVIWAYCPPVVYGSTTIMSDLVAALFVLLSYCLYRRDRVFWSAFSLAFALCVRPTNVLYLLVFSVILLRDRKLIRYGLYMLVPGAFYGFYNYTVFGAPWRTGYFDIRGDLISEVFRQHLGFYLWQILLQMSPLVLLLAFLGFRRPRGEKIFFAAWFAAFLLFYCFWKSGGDRWWWTRFLLPGFGVIFMLSALGFSRVRGWIDEKFAGSPRRLAAHVALFALIGITPFYYIKFALYQGDLLSTRKGFEYYNVVKVTEELVPKGSYVGSVEFAGSFRIYTQVRPYLSVHDNAPKLVDHAFGEGRDAYLIVEPWNQPNLVVQELLTRYSAVKVKDFDLWGGVPLYRLQKPAAP